MPVNIVESDQIKDVYLAHLQTYGDDRGVFRETFRKAWFPQRTWSIVQTNRSDSSAGVLRGLHYHFHQVDYWYVTRGRIRAALLDIRPDSPTFKVWQTIEMDAAGELGLFIPIGVAHGFVALTDATLTYLVDNYYNNDDELGVAWDDPDVGLEWGVSAPLISTRDATNPRLAAIPLEELPHRHK